MADRSPQTKSRVNPALHIEYVTRSQKRSRMMVLPLADNENIDDELYTEGREC
jgi:hypothetical protein